MLERRKRGHSERKEKARDVTRRDVTQRDAIDTCMRASRLSSWNARVRDVHPDQPSHIIIDAAGIKGLKGHETKGE